jgi:hypothetical protein
LKELCSDRLLEILIVNPSKLHIGQEVLHGYLQRFEYDLGDFHTPCSNGEEDREFIKVLIGKKKLEKNLVWELNCIALFGPLKQILPDINKFYRFTHL